MTNLTDKAKRELTLFLGERWHELEDSELIENRHSLKIRYYRWYKCSVYKKQFGEHYPQPLHPRTFTTPDDMVALVHELGRDGQWREFYEFCFKPYVDDNPLRMSPGDMCLCLMSDPARFCWLVSEFLTKTEVTGNG